MPKAKKPETGVLRGRYYEATRSGRGHNSEVLVRVWPGDKREGEPSHEWEMPGILPNAVAVDQAVLQSK